jgi:hypothetical protein
MALITDPDNLNQGTEVTINTGAQTIDLNIAGNLSTDGVTLKALYSFLKEEWKNDAALIKFPFPMLPITDEQYEMVSGWDFADDASRYLIRTGGWAVKNLAGNTTQEWACVITLGSLESDDQVYFQQSASGSPVDIQLTGPVNQAVQIYKDDDGDGNTSEGSDFNRRSYLKLFVREWQQTYASSQLSDIGVSGDMSYQAYRFPLASGADLKVTHTENDVNTTTPYTDIDITYLVGTGFENATAKSYALNEVGKDAAGRWFRCSVAGTLNAAGVANYTNNGGTGTFVAYEGERQIGSSYYAFKTIIDANVDDTDANPTAEQIYEKVQWSLRQNADIDAGSGTVTGQTAGDLLRFVGDTLVTSTGVFIDDFNTNDTNRITMTDVGGVARTFPFVATLTINFGANLVADADAVYRVFFDDTPSGNYGTASAILVDDNDDVDMSGSVSGQSVIVHTFDYDGNTQGGRTAGTDADLVVVGIGLTTGQFVSANATISRSTANSVSLVAPLERNYANA